MASEIELRERFAIHLRKVKAASRGVAEIQRIKAAETEDVAGKKKAIEKVVDDVKAELEKPRNPIIDFAEM